MTKVWNFIETQLTHSQHLELFSRTTINYSPGHLALDQSKTLDISNFSQCRTYICVSWPDFPRYLKLFSKFLKLFVIPSSQISLFSTPVGIVAAIVLAKMSKDSQIDFFCSFLFDQMFWFDFLIPRIFNKFSL